MIEISLLFGKQEIDYYLQNDHLTSEMVKINLKKYSFETKDQCDAFIKGVEEGIGWQEVLKLDDFKVF